MGMPKQVIKLLLEEDKYKRIDGEFISFGKQTVSVTRSEMIRLLEKYGHDSKPIQSYYAEGRLDKKTRHGALKLEDVDVLSTFTKSNYSVMDISDYEGANILHDLNRPVPIKMHSKFDFVFTGGCLDNVFNPVSLLVNSSNLLKEGGRVVHYETFQGLLGAFLMFSPEWFYSYYSVNDFDDVKVYVCHHKKNSESRFNYDTDIYLWKPSFTRSKNFNYLDAATASRGILYCLVIAQKGGASSTDKMPIQLQYLDDNSDDWRRNSQLYEKSDRELLSVEYQTDYNLPFNSDHFVYLGSGY